MDQQNHSKLFEFVEKQFEDELGDDPCNNNDILSFFCTITNIFFLVALSHLIHSVLKRLGQTTIASQMLVNTTFLSHACIRFLGTIYVCNLFFPIHCRLVSFSARRSLDNSTCQTRRAYKLYALRWHLAFSSCSWLASRSTSHTFDACSPTQP